MTLMHDLFVRKYGQKSPRPNATEFFSKTFFLGNNPLETIYIRTFMFVILYTVYY